MSIIQFNQVSYAVYEQPLFESVNLTIEATDRIGIVGQNGVGKSTFLKLIAGEEIPDSGERYKAHDATIHLHKQTVNFDAHETVREFLEACFADISEIQAKMTALETKMSQLNADLEELLEQYGQLQEKFYELGGYTCESRLQEVANGLGLGQYLDYPLATLSGGQRSKVALAKCLLEQADILLLDEPTNHLDRDTIEWLIQFIHQYEGAILIVSHDRYLLDQVATRIFEIDDQHIYQYPGNYTRFKQLKEERLLVAYRDFKNQQDKIDRLKSQIKQYRQWGNEGHNPKHFKKAKNLEKILAKIEPVSDPTNHRQMNITVEDAGKKGPKRLVEFRGVSKSFNAEILSDVNWLVRRGEHIGIVGRNGVGKSTLLKLVAGTTKPDSGQIVRPDQLAIGTMSQHPFSNLSGKRRVIDVFRQPFSLTQEQARHSLAQFLFFGEDVFKSLGELSGGELMRLKWAQLIQGQYDLLLLDEPTNHLDIDSKELIEEVLASYTGSMVIVSHDRYFTDTCCNKLYELTNGQLNLIDKSVK